MPRRFLWKTRVGVPEKSGTHQEEHPLLQTFLGELVQTPLAYEFLQTQTLFEATAVRGETFGGPLTAARSYPAGRRQVLHADQVSLQLRQLLEVLQSDEAALEPRGDVRHLLQGLWGQRSGRSVPARQADGDAARTAWADPGSRRDLGAWGGSACTGAPGSACSA